MLRCFAIEAGALRPLALDPAGGLPAEAVWLDLVGPTLEEERFLEQALGIGIPTREEAGGIQVSDRLAARDGALYMSALVPAPGHAAALLPVTFVRAGDRLITVRYGSVDALDPFIAHYTGGQTAARDAGDLFAGLLETVVDRIDDALATIVTELERLSRGIFHHPAAVARRAGRRPPLGKRIRRLEGVIEDLGTQHEHAGRLRACLQSLIRLAAFSGEHADEALHGRLHAIETDLRAVAEHNGQLTADMEFMLDATVGLIDLQQNKVIYILSIVGVVLTPPVVVASVYGMNFQYMPELAWPYGYGWALGLMLVSAVGPYLAFKLKGWL